MRFFEKLVVAYFFWATLYSYSMPVIIELRMDSLQKITKICSKV